MSHLVVGAFRPFGGKSVNNATEVAARLQEMQARGELHVPEGEDVTFLPLETSAGAVDGFVKQALELGAGRVLMLGESGLRTHVETRALDRGLPGSLLQAVAREFVPAPSRGEIASRAPVEAMAQASGAKVSNDPGSYYCNYAYHSALKAGLNAVFVHVPSGVLGFGRQTEASARQVDSMVETWFLADSPATEQ